MKLNFKDGKADKVHILIDGEYRFTVDKTYFLGLGLYQNTEIDETELEKLEQTVEKRRAYNQAVSFLSRRDHSERELIIKLRRKGYNESGEAAVEKLRNDGYLDDRRFAEAYAKELFQLKKFGKSRVRQELMRKGIGSEIISDVLDGYENDENNITDIIMRKYCRCLNDEKGRKRIVSGLLRLGYSFGEIKAALDALCEETEFSEIEVNDE